MKVKDLLRFKNKPKIKNLNIEDTKSLIAFLLCVGILVSIPVYWFVLVPPALELQEINQRSYKATGYFAPGGYFKLEMNLDKESIKGLHNGQLNIIPHTINTQNESRWDPTEMRVDQWPGSKSEIKYSSQDPVNQMMILTISKIDIPQRADLKGKIVPITIKYFVNYPVQTGLTEIIGGTITNFEVNTDVIEKNITIRLNDQVITQKELDTIEMNENWKKVTSLVVWIIDFLILLLVFTEFKVIKNFKTNSLNWLKRVVNRIRKIIQLIEKRI